MTQDWYLQAFRQLRDATAPGMLAWLEAVEDLSSLCWPPPLVSKSATSLGCADAERASQQYRRIVASYDSRTGWLESCRSRTVAKLAIRPGEVVLDVGCGTGLCFPLIEQAIGPAGWLIGVEPSPEMRAKASRRIETHGWANVTLVESTAQEADIPAWADAVLFAFTHDVLRSPEALTNVFSHVKADARIAAAGPKWSAWAPLLNLATWYVARDFVTTFEGFARPWSELTRFVQDLQVEPTCFDTVYIAWGRRGGVEEEAVDPRRREDLHLQGGPVRPK
jgi:SAM-dependent methyltransferase